MSLLPRRRRRAAVTADTSFHLERRGWSEESSGAFIRHVLEVLELRRSSAAHHPQDIQLFVQYTDANHYAAFRRAWHQRITAAKGTHDWGRLGTDEWHDRVTSTGAVICVPLAPNAPLPVGRRPVRFLAQPFCTAGPDRPKELQTPAVMAQVVVAMWLSKLPDHYAPVLAPPILDVYGGPAALAAVGPAGAAWPLPEHPDLVSSRRS